jgi:hypothetical protein
MNFGWMTCFLYCFTLILCLLIWYSCDNMNLISSSYRKIIYMKATTLQYNRLLIWFYLYFKNNNGCFFFYLSIFKPNLRDQCSPRHKWQPYWRNFPWPVCASVLHACPHCAFAPIGWEFGSRGSFGDGSTTLSRDKWK